MILKVLMPNRSLKGSPCAMGSLTKARGCLGFQSRVLELKLGLKKMHYADTDRG